MVVFSSGFFCCLSGYGCWGCVCFCLCPTSLGKLLYASLVFEEQAQWSSCTASQPGRYESLGSGGGFCYTKILSCLCFPLKASLSLNNISKNGFSANHIQSSLFLTVSTVLSCWQTVGLGRNPFTCSKYFFFVISFETGINVTKRSQSRWV